MLGWVLLTATMWISPRMIGGAFAGNVVLGILALRRRRWGELAVIIAGVLLFFAYNLFLWGQFLPLAFDPDNRPQLHLLPRGLMIAFFGNDVGLLFLNPALWVGVAAAALLGWRHRSELFWVWLAMALAVLFGAAMLPIWRAGTCPAGRYQTTLAFLLLWPVLRVFAVASYPWRLRLLTTLVVLGAVGLTIGLFMAVEPRYWFRYYNPLVGYTALQPYYDWLPPSDPARFGLKRYSLCWLLIFCATLGLYDFGKWVISLICRGAAK
jgi:hypothetical protein